ncbi:MAG: fibronectin type III domain-containing protein [Nitrospiraceae bacterium]|nr:MAG: fibronectin type III domain-containing protein [Nitrospiraceae bacterium]
MIIKILACLVLITILCGCGVNAVPDMAGPAPAAAGSVTLSWSAPEKNVDGTPLVDLAGYRVYYGRTSSDYANSADTNNETEVHISNLTPGQWCFAVTAYDATFNESGFSLEACTVI